MTTKCEQIQEEIDVIKEKLDSLAEIKKPLQQRFTYLKNRLATIKYREVKRKVK